MNSPIAVIAAGDKTSGGNSVDRLWDFLIEGGCAAALYDNDRLPADVRVLACGGRRLLPVLPLVGPARRGARVWANPV